MNRDRQRPWCRLPALAGAFVAVAVAVAAPGLAAAPRPGGVYTGALVNEDKVQLDEAANGKSATFTVGCMDLGETYPFPRFPIVHGAFNAIISVPGQPGSEEAKLHGTFTSPTRVSIVLNEHPDKADADRYLCFGITSPATLTLKGK